MDEKESVKTDLNNKINKLHKYDIFRACTGKNKHFFKNIYQNSLYTPLILKIPNYAGYIPDKRGTVLINIKKKNLENP